MKKGICFVVALLAVIGIYCLSFAGKPEGGTGVGMFQQHLIGTWDVVNESSSSPYDAEGELVFSWNDDGIEVELISGVFAAGRITNDPGGPFGESCIGAWPIVFYEKNIAVVKWEAVDWMGNYAGLRKSPLYVMRSGLDKIFVIGMGYTGMGTSTLTRQ